MKEIPFSLSATAGSLPAYSVVTGSSGHGKTREYVFRAWCERKRIELVRGALNGDPPQLSTGLCDAITPGAARHALVTSTSRVAIETDSIASFLELDKIFARFILSSRERLCPHCQNQFSSVTNARDALNALLSVPDGHSVTISLQAEDERVASSAAALGYVRDLVSGNFLIDEGVDPQEDVQRLRGALEAAFSFSDAKVLCTFLNTGLKRYFAKRGACPLCGMREPVWRHEVIDFNLVNSDESEVASLELTRGFSKAEPELVKWLAALPVGNVGSLADFSRGMLGTLPRIAPFNAHRELITSLSLQHLPLLRSCRRIATSEWTKLVVAWGILNTGVGNLLVVDGASRALDARNVNAMVNCLRESSQKRSIVVIDNHPSFSLMPAVVENSTENIDPRLNSAENGTLKVTSGELTMITGPSGAGKSRWLRAELSNARTPYEQVTLSAANGLPQDLLAYEYLELDGTLSELFAASIEARSAGLDARRFRPRSRSNGLDFCSACRGAGIVRAQGKDSVGLPFLTCSLCEGHTVHGLVASVRYRSLTISDFLNMKLGSICELLKDVSSFSRTHTLLISLGLEGIRMGLPLGACSEGERYRLLLLKTFASFKAPTVFVVEHPEWRLDDDQFSIVCRFLKNACVQGHCVFVETQCPGKLSANRTYSLGS